MSAISIQPHFPAGRYRRQSGATAVEVAILSMVFFTIVFATMELARSIYIFNTLQEVTRRTASEVAKRAPASLESEEIADIKRRAIFSDKGDSLFIGAPVTINHIQIEYQSLIKAPGGGLRRVRTTPSPTCPIANRRICMANPNDPACVRFVRVRICPPGAVTSCNPVPYEPAFPLFPLNVNLPRASTVATVETLGYVPGAKASCL